MLSRADFASKKSGPSVNQVIVDPATAITSSFSKATSIPSRCSRELKLYKQLSELHSLKNADVLNEEEY